MERIGLAKVSGSCAHSREHYIPIKCGKVLDCLTNLFREVIKGTGKRSLGTMKQRNALRVLRLSQRRNRGLQSSGARRCVTE